MAQSRRPPPPPPKRPKTSHEEILERLDDIDTALRDIRAVQTCQNLFLHDLRAVADRTALGVVAVKQDTESLKIGVASLLKGEAEEHALAFVTLRLERGDVGQSH